MIILKQINEIANLWNKTKNPKYKDLWYKVVKEFADGRTSSLHYVDNSNTKKYVEGIETYFEDKKEDNKRLFYTYNRILKFL